MLRRTIINLNYITPKLSDFLDKNGNSIWTSTKEKDIRITNHYFDDKGNPLVFDNNDIKAIIYLVRNDKIIMNTNNPPRWTKFSDLTSMEDD